MNIGPNYPSLVEILEKEAPLPLSHSVQWMIQLTGAVKALHKSGIVHGDLVPERFYVTSDGETQIILPIRVFDPKSGETRVSIFGDCASPEYLQSGETSESSDIYALGIIGYELLTGESPFRAKDVYSTMQKRMESQLSPPSSIRPECPAALDGIILKTLAKTPEGRYSSAGDLKADLEEVERMLG